MLQRHDDEDFVRSLGLRERIARRLRVWRPRRPVSLFLMCAMVIGLLLGGQIVYATDDPKKFTFLLALFFIFFLVILLRAILEFFDVLKEHVIDRERVFRETFAEDDFTNELGRRVSKKNADSWPES